MADQPADDRERSAFRIEIESRGFRQDPLLARHADRSHYGLNVTALWPLPKELERAYADFARRVSALCPGLYLYPFATTHVTLVTAVNFKSYPDAAASQVRLIDHAARELGDFLAEASGDLR